MVNLWQGMLWSAESTSRCPSKKAATVRYNLYTKHFRFWPFHYLWTIYLYGPLTPIYFLLHRFASIITSDWPTDSSVILCHGGSFTYWFVKNLFTFPLVLGNEILVQTDCKSSPIEKVSTQNQLVKKSVGSWYV